MAKVWKGLISFGLVNIPVSAHPAVRDDALHFRLLEKETLLPIKNQRISRKTGKPLAWDSIIKGYEFEKDQFVTISDDDIRRAAQSKSETFEIEGFVHIAEIDPRFFEKSYFLTSEGGEKAYALLRDAMIETGMVGIGQVTMGTRQRLAAVRPYNESLMLETMRFQDEIIPRGDFEFPKSEKTKPQELAIAKQLIAQLATEFAPSTYINSYKANLEKIIQSKLRGKKVSLKTSEPSRDQKVVDLMERLKASLDKSSARNIRDTYAAKTSSKELETKGKAAKKKSSTRKKKSS